jgi:hypothetical protein
MDARSGHFLTGRQAGLLVSIDNGFIELPFGVNTLPLAGHGVYRDHEVDERESQLAKVYCCCSCDPGSRKANAANDSGDKARSTLVLLQRQFEITEGLPKKGIFK